MRDGPRLGQSVEINHSQNQTPSQEASGVGGVVHWQDTCSGELGSNSASGICVSVKSP